MSFVTDHNVFYLINYLVKKITTVYRKQSFITDLNIFYLINLPGKKNNNSLLGKVNEAINASLLS